MTMINFDSLKILSFPHLSFWRLEVIAGDDVNEEVKLIKLSDGHGDVIPLENKKLDIYISHIYQASQSAILVLSAENS